MHVHIFYRYTSDRNDVEQRMDNHGKLIEKYFTSGNFTDACQQLKCEFQHIKADPIRQVCRNGRVEETINGKPTCSKLIIYFT